jgi:hypothetical protein
VLTARAERLQCVYAARSDTSPCPVLCCRMFRHTAYNKLDAHGKQWSDPTVFDAPLTAKGRQQVRRGVLGTQGLGRLQVSFWRNCCATGSNISMQLQYCACYLSCACTMHCFWRLETCPFSVVHHFRAVLFAIAISLFSLLRCARSLLCRVCRPAPQAQAAHMEVSRQLEKHGHLGACLWLTSPLSRAIETMLLAFPDVEALAQGRPGSARGPSSGAVLAAQPADHRVVVLRCGCDVFSPLCTALNGLCRAENSLVWTLWA